MDDLWDMAWDTRRLSQRNGWWYYERRTPKDVAALGAPPRIRRSLRTDSQREAVKLRDLEDKRVEAYWEAVRNAGTADDDEAEAALATICATAGFDRKPVERLADEAGVGDLIARLQHLERTKTLNDERHVAALLGGRPTPPTTTTLRPNPKATRDGVRLSALVEVSIEHAREQLVGKSPSQKRKHINARNNAVASLRNALEGDPRLDELGREHFVTFRAQLQNRIEAGALNVETANKYIQTVSSTRIM